ncbi:transglutaminase-like domain-containing protein [Actinomadura roseirufa]|uniref:transglutaminase-like domain-containing protein n=1 Tax=Actinomadura roseirufa TaxID=2094049 RepID=UPI001041778E|nr:transglutaminase family protein [Actinomadura roseirufa]
MDFAAEPWDYLTASEAIDIEHPLVVSTASALRDGDDIAYARAAFDHVRDDIAHVGDIEEDPREEDAEAAAWRASDVLARRSGHSHGKAHAYVALLRAGGVQAGLCYQPAEGALDGLVAVLVDDRWVLLDPRGGEPGGGLVFSASEDRLARPSLPVLPTVHAAPPHAVLEALKSGVRPAAG